jgi:hypothetical protein
VAPSARSGCRLVRPSNDPFVMTVGCLDENQTKPRAMIACARSAAAAEPRTASRPYLVAWVKKIDSASWQWPEWLRGGLGGGVSDRITDDGRHIRLSGTSMFTDGRCAVALMLEQNGAFARPGGADSDGHARLREGWTRRAMSIAMRSCPRCIHRRRPDIRAAAGRPGAAAGQYRAPRGWLTPSNTYWDGSRRSNAYWDGSAGQCVLGRSCRSSSGGRLAPVGRLGWPGRALAGTGLADRVCGTALGATPRGRLALVGRPLLG